MQQRVLEPEVMDTDEDAREYDAMDFADANSRFAEDALALIASVKSPRILDLGTGTAAIPIEMIRRRPDAQIVGLDLAESMLVVAREKARVAGIAASLDLRAGDVKATGLAPATFDLVMSNSTAHHLPDPLAMFREIARLTRPGGAILVRDLFRPETAALATATVERVAPNDSPRQKQLFLDSLNAALTVDEVRALARDAGLEGTRIAVVSDRHWTVERAAVSAPQFS